jgi:hypothetical protein
MTVLLYIKQITDFVKNEIRNVVLHKVSGAPGTPVEGQFWYDTATQHLKYENASTVVDPHDRATHTGSQTASTISDFNTAVRTNTLNQMAGPTADLAIGTHKITGLSAGTTAGDAVEYNQLNAAIASSSAGLSWKQPVEVATTANITSVTAGAPNVVDGVTLSTLPNSGVGARILVKAQTSSQENGIYTVTTVGSGANGVWARATDADSAAELQGGTLVPVDQGTTFADTVWMLAGDVVTLGTTTQTWTQFGAGAVYTASLGVQKVGNDFRANLGAGLTLSGNTIVPDYTAGNVMKNKVAVGFVGTSGVDVTINHALGLANKDDYLCEVVEVGVGKVMVGELSTDVNNLVLSFAVTPSSNQYRYKIVGLS